MGFTQFALGVLMLSCSVIGFELDVGQETLALRTHHHHLHHAKTLVEDQATHGTSIDPLSLMIGPLANHVIGDGLKAIGHPINEILKTIGQGLGAALGTGRDIHVKLYVKNEMVGTRLTYKKIVFTSGSQTSDFHLSVKDDGNALGASSMAMSIAPKQTRLYKVEMRGSLFCYFGVTGVIEFAFETEDGEVDPEGRWMRIFFSSPYTGSNRYSVVVGNKDHKPPLTETLVDSMEVSTRMKLFNEAMKIKEHGVGIEALMSQPYAASLVVGVRAVQGADAVEVDCMEGQYVLEGKCVWNVVRSGDKCFRKCEEHRTGKTPNRDTCYIVEPDGAHRGKRIDSDDYQESHLRMMERCRDVVAAHSADNTDCEDHICD